MSDVVSLQWALDETVSSLFGVIRAATSDNIPPGALYAAQSFGATLSMGENTKRRVQHAVQLYELPDTIKFLKCKIGFVKGDSADQLLSTEGGVRFLALAAALLCTSSSFFAAQTLHSLLMDTAPTKFANDTMFPTTKMLQQLLDALDHKLCRAGFARDVSGWQKPLEAYDLGQDGDHPSLEMTKALVLSFGSVNRLGKGVGVEIRAHVGIPWMIAFTKWCFDDVPCVIACNGTVVLENPDYKVLLLINERHLSNEEVRIVHKIESPDILWSGRPDGSAWTGMLSVGEYGAQHMERRGIRSPDATCALREALSCSIPVVLKRLWPMKIADSGMAFHPALGYTSYRGCPPRATFKQFRSHMFGNPDRLESAMVTYFSAMGNQMAQISDNRELRPLPALEVYLQGLISSCGCSTCSHDSDDYEEDGPLGLKIHHPGSPTNIGLLAASICGKATQNSDLKSECAVMRFWALLSIFTAEILAISLYDFTDHVQIFWPGEEFALARTAGTFTRAVYSSLFWNNTEHHFCRVQNVLQLATALLGHKVEKELESSTWVASAFRGQVIFPLLVGLGGLTSSPLLLGGGPGRLSFQGSYFEKMLSRTPKLTETPNAPNEPASAFAIDRTHMRFSDEDLSWQIGLTAESPELFFGTPRAGPTIYNPHDVLSTVARSLFVRCAHKKDNPNEALPEDCEMTNLPFYENTGVQRYFNFESDMANYIGSRSTLCKTGPFKIQVLPTAGKKGLRLFAMVSSLPGVVNDGACLECCIEVCRKSGLEYIVL